MSLYKWLTRKVGHDVANLIFNYTFQLPKYYNIVHSIAYSLPLSSETVGHYFVAYHPSDIGGLVYTFSSDYVLKSSVSGNTSSIYIGHKERSIIEPINSGVRTLKKISHE